MNTEKSQQDLHFFGHSLTFWILIALFLGCLFGIFLNFLKIPSLQLVFVDFLFPLGGQIFFSFLKLLVVPVVFVSLVCGVGALKDIKKMGRIGSKTIALYLFTTAVAIALALLMASITKPGVGFILSSNVVFTGGDAPSLKDVLLGMIPTNPVKAMADGNMLQIIILALAVGISISLSRRAGERVLKIFEDFNEVLMRLVVLVMAYAPIGVFCLLAEVFAKQGLDVIIPLSKYFFTVLVVLLIHFVFVYGSLLKALGRLSPFVFVKKFREVLVFAFSTSSSNATLPVTLEVVEHQLGVKNPVASFTLPLGATINMDGTAIMQGVATVFIAQVYGVNLSVSDFLMVIGTATLASIGTAGVPGVGLVTLAMVLKQVHLPIEGIGLIIGVDRLLDMTRTAVNVTGDAVVTCIVANAENQLDLKVYETLEPV